MVRQKALAEKKTSKDAVGGEGYFTYETAGDAAAAVRAEAAKIRQKLKDIIGHTIEIGESLLKAKKLLRHGQFVHWVRAEFAWSERTAQNYMSVARRFGAKAKLISDLPIWTTAAFRLAAPSVSDEAREMAIERARAGETITVDVAECIIAMTQVEKSVSLAPASEVNPKVKKSVLYQLDRCLDDDVAAFADNLRELTAIAEARAAEIAERRQQAAAGLADSPAKRPMAAAPALAALACGDVTKN